jgi:hypothetical protein
MSATVVRNVVIVLALAALVAIAPGGGNASAAILQALLIAMLGAIVFFAVRLYREHRMDLYGLGDRNRAILYASIGLATLTVTGTSRLWETGAGVIAWFALICLAVYGVYYVFRASREY